jgi:hypothetical protein
MERHYPTGFYPLQSRSHHALHPPQGMKQGNLYSTCIRIHGQSTRIKRKCTLRSTAAGVCLCLIMGRVLSGYHVKNLGRTRPHIVESVQIGSGSGFLSCNFRVGSGYFLDSDENFGLHPTHRTVKLSFLGRLVGFIGLGTP